MSDGQSGSYAETNTDAVAKLFMTATNQLGTASVAMWVRGTIVAGRGMFGAASGAFANPTTSAVDILTTGSGFSAAARNNLSATIGATKSGVTASSWTLIVLSTERVANDLVAIAVGSDTAATGQFTSTARAAGTVARVGDRTGGALPWQGAYRNIGFFNRRLSDAERESLVAAGPNHNLRLPYGNFLGGARHYYPLDGDKLPTITDRGVIGGCNLTVVGGMTLQAV